MYLYHIYLPNIIRTFFFIYLSPIYQCVYVLINLLGSWILSPGTRPDDFYFFLVLFFRQDLATLLRLVYN